MEIKIGGVYEHYKKKKYRVLGFVVHSETLEKMVYYECLYENELGKHWVRPFDNFTETVLVDGVKINRFNLIEQV